MRKCQACHGPFVSRDYPFCQRCADKIAEQKHKREVARWKQDRADACAWARQLLAQNPPILILDTETTGLQGYIVQIAIIDSMGTVLLDTLVNPREEIEDGAQAIHGITLEQVVDAPSFGDLHGQLLALLLNRTVAIYNMNFDVDVLLRERERLGHRPGRKVMYGATWLDVMEPYSAYVGEPGRRNSEYRWQRLPGGDHTALGDCRATLAVLKELATNLEENDKEIAEHG